MRCDSALFIVIDLSPLGRTSEDIRYYIGKAQENVPERASVCKQNDKKNVLLTHEITAKLLTVHASITKVDRSWAPIRSRSVVAVENKAAQVHTGTPEK